MKCRLISVWVAGRRGVRTAAGVSYSLSVEYAVFVKRIAYKSAERRSPAPGPRPLGICRFRSLSEQHFHDLRNCWTLESRDFSRFGTHWLQQSLWTVDPENKSCDKACGKELWWRHCSSFLLSSARVSTCLCSGHWLIIRIRILVQVWLGYKIWFVPCRFSQLWVVNVKKLMQDVSQRLCVLIGCMPVIVVFKLYSPCFCCFEILSFGGFLYAIISPSGTRDIHRLPIGVSTVTDLHFRHNNIPFLIF
jgi:hypothetical protein